MFVKCEAKHESHEQHSKPKNDQQQNRNISTTNLTNTQRHLIKNKITQPT